jgi:parallel beta helix pectate lyase-like protein/flagellar hook capping protein FlgD
MLKYIRKVVQLKYAFRLVVAVQLFLCGNLFSQSSSRQIIYVDKQLSGDCDSTYSIASRDCNGSDGDAYTSLAGAASVATAGVEVQIRGGIYSKQLSPKHSGSEGNYIIFRNYQDEVVEITGESLKPAVWIDRKDYIAIEGLQVRNVRRWLNALGSDHLIIRNNIFEKALDSGGSSKTGLFFQSSNYVKILNNKMHDTTQDNLGMVDCDYSLIEGNRITKGFHALWALKCSNYNIIRNNYFHNELQKIGEIYDCDNAGYGSTEFPKLNSVDDAKYNVVEGNIFAYTASSGNSSPFAGIQYAAQNGIIRNNIFYECTGPPLDFTIYGGEAQYNYGNRTYNNVFYNNNFGGINITSSGSSFSDQIIKNNLFYQNRFIQNDIRWSWYAELDTKPVQIMTGRTNNILFDNNNIFNEQVDELYTVSYGTRFSSSNPAPQTLSWWEENHPQLFKNSVQANPLFVNASSYDFSLQEGSPMIDAGAFLTQTSGSGSNSLSMQVVDAGWFMNGFGVVSADTIQIEGQTGYAIITSVDYSSNTLSLDRALTWADGEGVSLKYVGAAPDIGTFEFGDAATSLNPSELQGKRVIPEAYTLANHPNPFNPSTQIFYSIPRAGYVSLIVYDSTGREVERLVTAHKPAGKYSYTWNAVNSAGRELASNIYFLQLESGGYSTTHKITLLR